ncbi:MAG: ATP-dependent DNA helicase, partial [Myxococcota bacterium]
ASDGFFGCLKDSLREGRHAMAEALSPELTATLKRRCQILTDEVERLATWLETTDGGSATERLHERCRNVIADAVTVTNPGQKDTCHIIERRGRGIFLEAQPIHIGHLFQSGVLNRDGAQIYTSATLTTHESFDFFLSRLGMRDRNDVVTTHLSPVFNYAQNALLYVPRRLPAPDKDGWLEGVCTIIKYLVDLSKGRAFVLFTSYRNMEWVFEELSEQLDYTLLKQGDMPRGELLQTFRDDVHSVLFATSSFWEGVDVEGESLSLVIMDKLPFANPSDPLTQARMQQIEERGAHPFSTYQIPAAIIALKQGFGRLIRSKRDRGVVAILDSRLASRSYGKHFLQALPPARVVWNAIEVKHWWEVSKGD